MEWLLDVAWTCLEATQDEEEEELRGIGSLHAAFLLRKAVRQMAGMNFFEYFDDAE